MHGAHLRRNTGTPSSKEGEAFLGKPYEPLAATLFLEYARNGNRSRWEAVQFGRRTHLRTTVLAECMEGKGRFLDDIADGIWAICEESFWGVPAHMGAQKRGVGLPDVQEPIIELFSAETGALLAWTDYLFGKQLDKVHPLIRERLESEIDRRLLSVVSQPAGLRLDGPEQLCAGEQLESLDPLEPADVRPADRADPARRAQTVHKILTSLDRFLDPTTTMAAAMGPRLLGSRRRLSVRVPRPIAFGEQAAA